MSSGTGGTRREPQVIRAKLLNELCSLGDGLEPYSRVRFLGTTATYSIQGKTYTVVTLADIELVPAAPARGKDAA